MTTTPASHLGSLLSRLPLALQVLSHPRPLLLLLSQVTPNAQFLALPENYVNNLSTHLRLQAQSHFLHPPHTTLTGCQFHLPVSRSFFGWQYQSGALWVKLLRWCIATQSSLVIYCIAKISIFTTTLYYLLLKRNYILSSAHYHWMQCT